MSGFINIGFGNMVNSDKIIAIVNPQAAPVKRLVQNAKEDRLCVDATQGRKTKTVLVMDSGHTVLSALVPETISKRLIGGGTQEHAEMLRTEIEDI